MAQLLPALRRAAIDPALAEFKSLTIDGPGIYPVSFALGPSSMYMNRGSAWNLEKVIQDAYERGVWVFKSVDLYARNNARLPFVLESEDGDEKVTKHPLLRVLNVQANPLESARVFKKRIAAQLLLSKAGVFIELTHTRGGVLSRLDLLAPDRVRIMPDTAGEYVDYFEYTQPDGVVRNLKPEKVVWIRDPHPTDAFCGVTPLEAAGISVELDHLARIYNNSFIKRDARPGGIIGIDTDTLDDRELSRIEKVFQPGAHHAGKITAIGTGPGGIKYIDTSARPRDMAYEHTSQKAKEEILGAFSVPESMLGLSAGKTYENSAQDAETFYEGFVDFLAIITDAFARLVDDADLFLRHDTSSIEALELKKKRARAEAREEFNMGLRSVKEYRKLRPELVVIDNPHTRALWLAPSKAPVPATDEDGPALGVGEMLPADGAMPAAGGDPAAGMGGALPLESNMSGQVTAEDALADDALAEQASGGVAPGMGAPLPPVGGDQAVAEAAQQPPVQVGADQSVGVGEVRDQAGMAQPGVQNGTTDATGVRPDPPDLTDITSGDADPTNPATGVIELPTDPDDDLFEQKALAWLASMEVKQLPDAATSTAPAESTYTAPATELERLELAVKAAIDAQLARQVGVIKARLESPKTRRGTRFWSPEYENDTRAGTNPIDTARVVAAERWANELSETLGPIVEPASTEAAAGLLTAMAAAGALVAPLPAMADVVGRVAEAAAVPAEEIATMAGNAAQLATLAAIAIAERAIVDWINERRADMDKYLVDAQPSLADVAAWVEDQWAKRGRAMAESVALSVAQSALGAARDAAAESVAPMPEQAPGLPGTPTVSRRWNTRQDERVRSTHLAAEGQERPLGATFDIGGEDLRFPSDPLASAAEGRWCRCWLTYAWPTGAQFTRA